VILGGVFFAGLFLVALSQSSSAAVRPQAEAHGFFTAGINWLTTGLSQIWHAGVRATISRFAASHLIPIVRWFSSLNALVLGSATTVRDLSVEMADTVERLTGHVLPREIGKGNAAAKAQAKAASKTAHAALGKANSTSTALGRYKVTTAPKIAHATHAIDVTLPRTIGDIRTREGELARDQAKLRERTTSLENGAVRTFEWIRTHPLSGITGVFAGAVAVALTQLGFGFLRCRSWKGVGKRITCGMGDWIGELLTLIATFGLAGLSVLDPEALAEAAVATVDAIEPLLQEMLP
jgi:hypothetical protein